MPRRLAVALLPPPTWHPPGVDPSAWQVALAEDVLDVLAAMVEVEAAVAVRAQDSALLTQVGWPGLRSYALPALDVVTVLAAVAADGFEQAVLLAGDAPDLPGMLIAKLLRPLTTRPVAAAPALGASSGPWDGESLLATPRPHSALTSSPTAAVSAPGPTAAGSAPRPTAAGSAPAESAQAVGLLGLSAVLPAPEWLPRLGLDDLTPQSLRRLAPQITDVAPAPGWHRLRSAGDLARLDPRLEGWDATRALLSAPATHGSRSPR